MKNEILICSCTCRQFQNYNIWATLQNSIIICEPLCRSFYLQHSYFVKNAMLINSAVSFGLGIRNEEFIICFLRPHLIDIGSTSASPMHSYLFTLGKRFMSRCFFEIVKGFSMSRLPCIDLYKPTKPTTSVHNDTEMAL